jgi:hypothetical protein
MLFRKHSRGAESAIRICSAAGVTGTLGCLARGKRDARLFMLSSWHVLFADGARGGSPIWRVEGRDSDGQPAFTALGGVVLGRSGTVTANGGGEVYVDCAIGWYGFDATNDYVPRESRPCGAQVGQSVRKLGAGTGLTEGTLVDTAYEASTEIGGRARRAPGQLLVRSERAGRPFSVEGDSGALVVDERDEPVGLLWGSTSRGEGVACPIAPVLKALDIATLLERRT